MKLISKDGLALTRGVPIPFVIHWRGATSMMPFAERRRIIGSLSYDLFDGEMVYDSATGNYREDSLSVPDQTYHWEGYGTVYNPVAQTVYFTQSYEYSVGMIRLREKGVIWPGLSTSILHIMGGSYTAVRVPGYQVKGNKLLFLVASLSHYGSISGYCDVITRDSPAEPGGLLYRSSACPVFGLPGGQKVSSFTYLGYVISFFRTSEGVLRYAVEPKITYDGGFTQPWEGYYSFITVANEQLVLPELTAIDAAIMARYRSFLERELPTIEFLQPGIPPAPHIMALPPDIGVRDS